MVTQIRCNKRPSRITKLPGAGNVQPTTILPAESDLPNGQLSNYFFFKHFHTLGNSALRETCLFSSNYALLAKITRVWGASPFSYITFCMELSRVKAVADFFTGGGRGRTTKDCLRFAAGARRCPDNSAWLVTQF